MTTLEEIMQGTRDTYTVSRVFGEPIERDGVTIIPVATVAGGGGGGQGPMTQEAPGGELAQGAEGQEAGAGTAEGSGGGFGGMAKPAGVYTVKAGHVTYQPAVDVTRLGIAAMILAGIVTVMALLLRRH